jgi:hypothetical protein
VIGQSCSSSPEINKHTQKSATKEEKKKKRNKKRRKLGHSVNTKQQTSTKENNTKRTKTSDKKILHRLPCPNKTPFSPRQASTASSHAFTTMLNVQCQTKYSITLQNE